MQYATSRRRILQLTAAYGLCCATPAFAKRQQINIFFDYESIDMSESAVALADRLSHEILPSDRVTIVGNADTAEASPERISYARGNEVLKYFLRKRSLVKVRFNVVANGITTPLVKTGPNVREPKNRRVEVIIT